MDLITAQFSQESEATAAVTELRKLGFTLGADNLSADPNFHVSPEPAVSAGAEESAPSAAKSAVVGGVIGAVAAAAAAPLLGPGAILVGTGVGAYAGSLIGALNGLNEASETDEAHVSSEDCTVHVVVTGASGKSQAMETLVAHGARSISERHC